MKSFNDYLTLQESKDQLIKDELKNMEARDFNKLRDAYYELTDAISSILELRLNDDTSYHVSGEIKNIQRQLVQLRKTLGLGKYL